MLSGTSFIAGMKSAELLSINMDRPQCCNRPATPYRRDYGSGGWESGFRCKRCGRIRLGVPFADLAYMDGLPAVRASGIEWEQKELSQGMPV